MTLIEYIPIIISIITYAIVFVIQKSLYTKQNDLMNSYKEVLKIMSLDEIKKHVALKEENLELNFSNRELILKNNENNITDILDRSEKLINGFENLKVDKEEMDVLKDDAELIIKKTNNYIDNRIKIDEQMIKFYDEEFEELYNFINNDLKSIDEFKGLFFENNLLAIRNEYILKRTELLKNIEKLN